MTALAPYYPWIITALALLSVHLVISRVSARYAKSVTEELSKHLSPGAPPPVPPAPPLAQKSDSVSIAEAKRIIRQTMTTRPPDLGQQLDLIIEDLAVARVEGHFVAQHAILYRSQIQFLKQLPVTGLSMSRSDAEAFYQARAAADAAVAATPFNDWVQYLVQQQFVNVSVDAIHLTVGGTDFLVWMIRTGVREKQHERI